MLFAYKILNLVSYQHHRAYMFIIGRRLFKFVTWKPIVNLEGNQLEYIFKFFYCIKSFTDEISLLCCCWMEVFWWHQTSWNRGPNTAPCVTFHCPSFGHIPVHVETPMLDRSIPAIPIPPTVATGPVTRTTEFSRNSVSSRFIAPPSPSLHLFWLPLSLLAFLFAVQQQQEANNVTLPAILSTNPCVRINE